MLRFKASQHSSTIDRGRSEDINEEELLNNREKLKYLKDTKMNK